MAAAARRAPTVSAAGGAAMRAFGDGGRGAEEDEVNEWVQALASFAAGSFYRTGQISTLLH